MSEEPYKCGVCGLKIEEGEVGGRRSSLELRGKHTRLRSDELGGQLHADHRSLRFSRRS